MDVRFCAEIDAAKIIAEIQDEVLKAHDPKSRVTKKNRDSKKGIKL